MKRLKTIVLVIVHNKGEKTTDFSEFKIVRNILKTLVINFFRKEKRTRERV